MKKIFCMICMIFSFSFVFAQDADVFFKRHLDGMDKVCAGQIELLDGTRKAVYIGRGRLASEGNLSKWNAEYYEKLSSVYGLYIQEAEFYRGMVKPFNSTWALLSDSEKGFVLDFLNLAASKGSYGSDGIYFLYSFLSETYVAKNKSFSVNERSIFNMLKHLLLFNSFFSFLSDHIKRAEDSLKSPKVDYSDSVEKTYATRYEMEKELSKLEKDFDKYFNGTKVPMSKKIDEVLGIK